jgi:hypothetical protein
MKAREMIEAVADGGDATEVLGDKHCEAGKAVGKVQNAIIHYLHRTQSGVTPLTDMVRYPTFRGIHFAKVEKAAEALAKKGMIVYKEGKVALK